MNIRRPGHYAGLLLTALAHCAAIYFLLQNQRLTRTPRAPRDAIQWLLPMPTTPTPRAAAPKPAPPPVRLKTPPAAPNRSLPVAEPAAPAPAADSAPPYDPFAQTTATTAPAAPGAADILAQARLDAGKIDRELRKTFPVAEPLPPPDSKQARLQRGFDAAHDAVPPKWYQGARMVELGTPDGENKTRTYKIITAFVTYCINIRPDGKKSYTNCP
ncbi:hypothetical protein JOD97_005679 [Duganella sp. 1411]|uniref:hypothetical protein n=1 Tax=Duganella sp. 1411 TaxID=2806572 RepID=UPI001AEAB0D0|nr:hypothetical protein [Duganella sp. 1411]MBP1207596.1 hypothetical protein [Duganella sp. 1411]